MKILQINTVCGYGSTGRIATDLYEVLQNNGHECSIAYGRGTHPENIEAYKVGTSLDNYFQVVQTRLFDRHGYGSKSATKKLVRKIEQFSPDIIHLHNIHGYYLNLTVLFDFLSKYKRPVVWTLHDCWAFTGHCTYFDHVRCGKWKSSCSNCSQKKEYPASLLLDRSFENFTLKKKLFTSVDEMVIVTPSNWLAKKVGKSFLSKYPIRVINNGIDLNTFRVNESNFKDANGINEKKIVLGVASVWDRRKGLEDFTKIASKLSDEYKIILVGLSMEQMKSLPKNIMGVSRTNSIEELTKIYSAADVFVNLTYEDNFPTTNLEALACGTPVITYNTGGSVEAVTESCGFIATKGDFEQVIGIIKKLEKDESLVEECIKRSKLFCKDERFEEYKNLYESILENS